ncbi:MAG: peptidylprolyl isomerase [Alphaproteobacteria bacterium]
MMRSAGLLILAVVTGLTGVGPVWAQSDGREAGDNTERLGAALDALGKGNPVLARVDGYEIRWADVAATAHELPEAYQGRIEAILPALLGRLIDRRLLVNAGREAGLAEDPDVRKKVTAFEDRAVSEAFVEQKISAAIDAKAIRARYEDYRQRVADRTEVRARHILLNSREEALDVIAALNVGVDFAALARVRSMAPGAEQGGDVGYFTRDSMAPEFAEMAFGLKVGDYSREPLETKFGWHVIKVEDRREEVPRSFFRMRDELRQETSRELLERAIADLRRKADIELFPEAADPPD